MGIRVYVCYWFLGDDVSERMFVRVHKKIFEKIGDVLIRLGETSIIAGAATLFVKELNILFFLLGIFVGIILIILGLITINKGEYYGN